MPDARLDDLTLASFLRRLGSADPTPGGGSAAALTGAMGAALVAMVCNLTLGREKFRDVEEEVQTIRDRVDVLRGLLQDGIDADAAAYDRVMAAYRLPRGSDDERARRSEAMQAATIGAARVPLAIAADAAEVLELAGQAAPITNANVASDVAVGALLAATAIRGLTVNVEVNLANVRDERTVAELREEVRHVLDGLDDRVAHVLRMTRQA